MGEKRLKKEDIIKFIDGNVFYRYDYADFLYQQLEIKDLIIKALYKYFNEHENYEEYAFLKQLESCEESDMNWLRKAAGEDNK